MPTEAAVKPERSSIDTLRRCEEQGDRPALAEACYGLALQYQEAGALAQAEALCRRSLVLNEALRNRAGVARAYLQLGLLRERRGDLGQARFFLGEAKGLYTAAGDAVGLATACGHLGFLHHCEGELKEAEALYRKALALGEQWGAGNLQAEQWANLGNLAVQHRQWAKACECFLRARESYLAAGDQRGADNHHYRMGTWWLAQRDLAQARDAFEFGLDAQRRHDWPLGVAMNSEGLAQVHQLLGQEPTAAELYRQAGAIFEQTGHLGRFAGCCERLGDLLGRGEDWAGACDALTKALSIFDEVGSRADLARVAISLGEAWFNAYPEQVEQAEALYLQGLEEHRSLPDLRGRGKAYVGLGNVALRRGEVSQAIAMWTAAHELYQRLGNAEQSRQIEVGLRQVSRAGRMSSVTRRLG